MDRKTPVHLWIVGVVSLLWNAIGATDYTMTKLQNAAWLAQFTAEQRLYFDSFPFWANVGWALGVWGSVAGSVLLLLRSRHAVTALAVSLAGLLISSLYQFGVARAQVVKIMTTEAWVVTALIWIIAIALFLYAGRMRSRDVLR